MSSASILTPTNNAFVTDIGNFIADPQKNPLPEYMFYSPNLDDDGHDPKSNPQEGLKKAADWLRVFLTTWLRFDDTTWVPKDERNEAHARYRHF